jgi:hypothetical protein
MHGPEKGNYQNECEFIKIGLPSVIVWKRHTQPLFQIVAIFEEVAIDKTRLILKCCFIMQKYAEK